jgi:hypothetical protein
MVSIREDKSDAMKLSPSECRLFYKLHPALMCYANWKQKILPDQPGDPAQFYALDPEKRVKVRDALNAQPDLIDQFVDVNPFSFKPDELEVVQSWKHALVGSFYVFRYLKHYTVFLSSEGKPKAYGVLALADPMEDVIGPYLPVLTKTVLLPFKDRIVYDGLVASYPLAFGGGIRRMLNDSYKKAKADLGIITSLPFSGEEPEPEEEPEAVIVTYDRSGEAHETRIGGKREAATFPLRLTQAQRRVVAAILPDLHSRLLLDQTNQRTLQFTLVEMKEIAEACRAAVSQAPTGTERNSLHHVVDAAERAMEKSAQGKIHRIPASERLYQFKITLKDIEPPIWRRIQVKDCRLDKLHEHIQTAMGWTNSHLHQFTITGVIHGDPQLLYEGWEDETPPVNSLRTEVSRIIPEDGSRFAFTYEYDFGDGWEHEVLFEGCLRAEKGARYPLCVEGERACPPEDVGGTHGYEEYLEAMADPKHEEHEEFMEWRGPFNPEAFDAQATTRRMQRGLPNWRKEEWI